MTLKRAATNHVLLFLISILIGCRDTAPIKPIKKENLSQYVNPNIGTAHSRWFFYTPASVPFGMAKLAPSTNGTYGNKSGWEAVGYDSRHESIEGFANLHEFQIGGFLFTGITGKLKTIPGKLDDPDGGYRSRFDKKDEKARPGYYAVQLKDYGIKVELTATKRVGFQRYTFPKSDSAYLIFDIGNQLGESGKVKDSKVAYNTDGSLEGYVITYPEYVKKYQEDGDIKMFFYAEVSKKPLEHGAFRGEDIAKNIDSIEGVGAGMYFKYNTEESDRITIKTGLSYTSIENAKANLRAEAADVNFNQAVQNAEEIWEREFDKIRVSDSSKTNKIKFYTALFHALLGRGLSNDVNGDFPQNDGTIGQIPLGENGRLKYNLYNTDSVWGAFWNLTQLWALVWPEYYNDFIQSQLEVYKNAGWLGDGIANGRYVSGVGTNFTGLVIAAGYQTGVLKDNVDLAYEAALKNEIEYQDRKEGAGKMDLKSFMENGFVPYIPQSRHYRTNIPEGSAFSVSHSLEYAFSSYAVAQMAHKMGKTEDYKKLMKLSEAWKGFYDKETGFFRPRLKNGHFIDDFDPLSPWIGFQEGNAWQYTFYVPQNPEELVQLIGRKEFNSRLDSIFEVSEKTAFGGEGIDAFAGVKTLYNHGNQPDLQFSWLFNFSDKPWLTQKWTRLIGQKFYGTEEVHGYGYGQDEDQGQLGAWYVMSSLGIFDVKGLTEENPSFQFGSPIFDKVTIKVKNDRDLPLTIETINNNQDNYYLDSIQLNGKSYNKLVIPFKNIIDGGNLKFYMSNSPNKSLGNN
ncbi:GH92 family glycosyl hydrolase [Flavobacteriaceae bacterium F89]|uniref:GH92 family glycosyl hydrolase n=1 Tax=Cerina litoralis TaxID=2874477 RepID=A0AAE3EZT9_9FLAO|nr:GH92 family glycosyl hydrolase [Cerina litoralis]MCG2462791.1 GH92 family glycosyl hydrolase [Cerina litoralis]